MTISEIRDRLTTDDARQMFDALTPANRRSIASVYEDDWHDYTVFVAKAGEDCVHGLRALCASCDDLVRAVWNAWHVGQVLSVAS